MRVLIAILQAILRRTREQSRSASADALERERLAQEEGHRRAERRYWFWSTLLTVGAFLGAAFTAVFTHGQLTEARHQTVIARRALVETERPVLFVADPPGSGILARQGAAPTVDFRVDNDGSRAAVVDYLEGTLNFGAPDVWPHDYCLTLMSNEALPAGRSFSATCTFNGAVPSDEDIVAYRSRPRFYGIVTYRSASGARWRRSFDYWFDPRSRRWMQDGGVGANGEVRIDAHADAIHDDDD